MFRTMLCCYAFLLLVSCSSYKLSVTTPTPAPYRNAHDGIIMGGAAQTDLTLPPGYAPAGYSIAGKYSRGVWIHPKATAVFMEDEKGTPFVIVACDLWGVTEGTSHKVVEILSKDPATAFLGEDNVVIAATHAHHAAGGYTTSSDYTMAGLAFGIEPFAISFMIDSIASAITKAVKSARPVTVSIGRTTIPGVSKNRSVIPFRMNPIEDREAIVGSGGGDSMSDDTLAVHAVRPVLTMITLTPLEGYDPQIVLCHFPLHPTLTGAATEVYSSDVFGIASERIRKVTGKTTAFINGAEGDVTVNSEKHDATVANSVGRVIADSAVALLSRMRPLTTRQFTLRTTSFDLVGQEFPYDGTGKQCRCMPLTTTQRTSKSPVNGTAMVGGASDGRTILYYMGLRDGVVSADCDPADGTKLNALVAADRLWVANKSVSSITSSLIDELVKGDGPSSATMTLLTIDDWSMLFTPAEFTTTMGLLLEQDVMKATGSRNALIVGLCDDYASYIATPCEYQLQFYEGASTLYGQATGELFRYHVSELAKSNPITSSGRNGRSVTYDCGNEIDLGVDVLAQQRSWNPEEGLSNLLVGEDGSQRDIAVLRTESTIPDPLVVRQGSVVSFTVLSNSSYPSFTLVSTQDCNASGIDRRETPLYVADYNDIVSLDSFDGTRGLWSYRLIVTEKQLQSGVNYSIVARTGDEPNGTRRSRCFRLGN